MNNLQFNFSNIDIAEFLIAIKLLIQELRSLKNYILYVKSKYKNEKDISIDELQVLKYKYIVCKSYIDILKSFTALNNDMQLMQNSLDVVLDSFSHLW